MSSRASYRFNGILRKISGSVPVSSFRGWRSRVAPCAPALLALAVLVFLWGLGYKLSLYHHIAKPVPRTTVAKLWTGPRPSPLLLTSIAGPTQHAPSGFHARAVTAGAFPQLRTMAASLSRIVLHQSAARNPLASPRSPPSPPAA